MNTYHKLRIHIVLIVIAIFAVNHASAQNLVRKMSRKQTWETSFEVFYMGAETVDFKGGSYIDSDSDVGWGFTLGYNLSEQLNFNFEFNTNRMRYKALAVPGDSTLEPRFVSHKMNTYTGQFNGIYHFDPGPVTPYIQAGLGWTNIDSNVTNGPPSTGCWWDPWWGYICSNYYRTYNKDSFSYNMALGLRVDTSRTTFVRASYGVLWVDMSKASSTPEYEIARLEFGMMM